MDLDETIINDEPGPKSPKSPEILEKFLKEEPDPWNNLGNAEPQPRDSSSVASEDFTVQDGDAILSFTLQVVYGIDLRESKISSSAAHQLIQRFVQDVGQHVWQAPPNDGSQNSQGSMDSSNSTPAGSGGDSQGSQQGGKRKKVGQNEDEGEEFSDGEGSSNFPMKRPRPSARDDENLRLSCPYRKRNPHRFNVRDHHSCAMTYFPKFAELRYAILPMTTVK